MQTATRNLAAMHKLEQSADRIATTVTSLAFLLELTTTVQNMLAADHIINFWSSLAHATTDAYLARQHGLHD